MLIIQQMMQKVLNAVQPFVYCLTGVAIVVIAITSIVVLPKFASFDKAWVYYLCITSIYITGLWWSFYFIYKGLQLFEQLGSKKEERESSC